VGGTGPPYTLGPFQAIKETWRALEVGVSPGVLPRPLSSAFKETWRALEVGVSPGELPRPLSSHQGDLEGP